MKHKYGEPRKFVRINEDPDLIPVKIYLPKPPDYKLIDGYGLDPKLQMFQHQKLPKKLKALQQGKNKDGEYYTVPEIWEQLELRRREFAEEIEWIKRMWYFRLYGYWFFNNGIPTYITGKHFFYLNFFRIDTGYPEYRERDMIYWLWVDFCEKDTYDFVNKDENGMAIPEEDGSYLFTDTGIRVCYGDVYPKYRREGATFRAQANNLETISKKIKANGGIQSRTDADGSKVFRKNLVPAFKKLQFFFKPNYASSTDPSKEIVFDYPSSRGKAIINVIETGLESSITFGTGEEGHYDGYKLHYFHDDEVGKTKKYDIGARHLVTKQCLSENFGQKIIGYTSKTSTSGEMEGGGGEAFEKMCKQSNFYQRGANGQTISGLYCGFISTRYGVKYDKYGNFIDQFDYIDKERSKYLSSGDLMGWAEAVRQHPLYFRECFMTSSQDMGFNIYKIEQRLHELKKKPQGKRVDLMRVNGGDLSSDIVVVDNPEKGRFYISKQMDQNFANKKYKENGIWYPMYGDKYTAGSDPFSLSKTEGSRQSEGGGSVFWERDWGIDPPEKEISEWTSNRFVCTYLYRPATTLEYADDMLKMCLYYGALMATEKNTSLIVERFTEWGFGGYLLYTIDQATNKVRNTPGLWAGENMKMEEMMSVRNYIELHGHRECHPEFLEQCKTIPSVNKLTDYDLLAACGVCLRGGEIGYRHYIKEAQRTKDTFDITTWLGGGTQL